jgi:5'-deoxynucleotidase YfbR-like HD superfamily hydrolase
MFIVMLVELSPRRDPLKYIGRRYPQLLPHTIAEAESPLRRGEGVKIIDASLDEIIRFGNGEKEMVCPTTVRTHTLRVEAFATHLTDVYQSLPETQSLDIIRVATLCRIHDNEESDPDIGDVTKDRKDAMSPAQRAAHERKVKMSLLRMGEERFGLKQGTPDWIRYVSYIQELMMKKSLEAQVAKLADLLDALGEVIHELRCGNQGFGYLIKEYCEALNVTKYPVWGDMRKHPSLDLELPLQAKDILANPPLMPLHFAGMRSGKAGLADFRHIILQEDLPPVYKTWVKVGLLRFGPQAPQIMFPKWNLPRVA